MFSFSWPKRRVLRPLRSFRVPLSQALNPSPILSGSCRHSVNTFDSFGSLNIPPSISISAFCLVVARFFHPLSPLRGPILSLHFFHQLNIPGSEIAVSVSSVLDLDTEPTVGLIRLTSMSNSSSSTHCRQIFKVPQLH